MSTASMELFQRFKSKGFAALRRQEYPQARLYLLEAARLMADLAAHSTGEVREGQKQVAAELLELALGIPAARHVEEKRRCAHPAQRARRFHEGLVQGAGHRHRLQPRRASAFRNAAAGAARSARRDCRQA